MLLALSFFYVTAPAAAAGESPETKAPAGNSTAAAPSINVSYALYNNTIKLAPRPVADRSLKGSLFSTTKLGAAARLPRPPAVSTAPMTVKEKAEYWARKSFLSPGAYGLSIVSGLWGELLDNDEGKKDTVENYFADAMTRAARSYAFRVTSGFFEKFAYASILKQDPRYHRSDKRGTGAKVIYAVSRLFVTQGDRCGCDQPNISFLAGGLTASFIANQWERDERSDTRHAFTRWTTHLALTGLTNILHEFIGGQ